MGRVGLSLFLAAFSASTVAAQDVAPPRPITVIAPKPVPTAPASRARPVPPPTARITTAGKRSGATGDLAAQCRTRCAETRYVCLVDDAGGQCDNHWSQCAAGCTGSAYSFATSAYVRTP